MIVKTFEIPALRFVALAAKDIVAASAQEPTEPTEKPRPSDFTTPEDDFGEEPAGE